MSTDYNVYIGPYIRVANPKRPHKIEVNCCAVKSCKLLHQVTDNKFCPSCGTPIKSVTKQENRQIEADGWEEFDDKLTPLVSNEFLNLKNKEIFIPNGGIFGKHLSLRFNHGIFKFEDENSSIEGFKDYYKSFLEKIQEMYKEIPVVEYGVITYLS